MQSLGKTYTLRRRLAAIPATPIPSKATESGSGTSELEPSPTLTLAFKFALTNWKEPLVVEIRSDKRPVSLKLVKDVVFVIENG